MTTTQFEVGQKIRVNHGQHAKRFGHIVSSDRDDVGNAMLEVRLDAVPDTVYFRDFMLQHEPPKEIED